MPTHPARRRVVAASVRLGLVAAAGFAVSTASAHDEDWRKLADKLPPVFGPVWTQGGAQLAAEGNSGDLLRARSSFNADGVTLNAQFPVNTFGIGSTEAQDCWGYVSPSGREYAIITLSNGYGFVEITDPNNSTIVGAINGPTSPWHDVKVVGDLAYGVSEGGGGIQVMDLGNIDGDQPGPRVTNVGNFQTSGHTSSHNIIVNQQSGELYVCGANIGSGGLLRVDLSNPRSPRIDDGWTQMYVHDAQVITPDSGPFAGREIAFCASGFNGGSTQTGLRIVDITNPSSPVVLSTLFYPSSAYSHQVWVSDDLSTLYLNDELDEQGGLVSETTTRVIDVSDFTSPQFVGTFSSGRPSIDHNLYVRDDIIYQANYTSGLRVFDAADNRNPFEIGFFDTFPSSDGASFNGAWSVYPFFPSGTVIVSSIEAGLFVLTIDALMDRLVLGLPGDAPTLISPAGGDTVELDVSERGLTLDVSSVKMIVSQGVDQTVVPGVPLGNGRFSFAFPPVACGEGVSYFFEASDPLDATFTLPANAPTESFEALVFTDAEPGFSDNFQQNLGWTVSSTASDGQWARGVPADDSRGAPGADFDGSGICFVTDNATGNSDVDGGFTRLTSPVFDLSGGGKISYAYWLNDVPGGPLSATDNLVVEVRPSAGAAWTEVARYGTAGSTWRADEVIVDAALASATMQARFTVSDDDPQGVVEAGIDAFATERLSCVDTVGPCNAADVAEPFGVTDLGDVDAFIGAFSAADPAADIAEPFGVVDLGDIDAFIAAFLAGCP